MYGDERRANIEAGIDVAKIDMELAKKTDEIDQAKAKKSRKQLNNFEKEVPEWVLRVKQQSLLVWLL